MVELATVVILSEDIHEAKWNARKIPLNIHSLYSFLVIFLNSLLLYIITGINNINDVKSILYADITRAGASENLIIIDDNDVKNVPAKTIYFEGDFSILHLPIKIFYISILIMKFQYSNSTTKRR